MAAIDAAVQGTGNEATYNTLKLHFDEDGDSPLNVETLLSHIRALRSVCGAGVVRGVTAAQLDAVEKMICDRIAETVNKPLPSTDSPYHGMAAWISGMPRHEAVEVFTTNYDLLIEQALEETRTPFFDGFVGSREPFFDIAAIEDDPLPPRWARLWKIHGSINWVLGHDDAVIRSESGGGAQLIYPSHLKYEQSRRMPYLAMLDRLKGFLRRPSAVLVAVGYSFGDDHINEVLVQGLQGNSTAMGFGLLFDSLGAYGQALNLAKRRVNLTLLARDRGVIATREDVYAAPDTSRLDGIRRTTRPDADPLTEITLGDFAVFAEFLREVIGRPHSVAES
ncbi:MAG TPA: SIR2 family protein [Nitrospira sp.]|nr:SIR2 family protein [Nitrospira sp.]